jgi:small subunit ribosomal protein S13
MARIAGVDLQRDKRVDVALTYIYGIGQTSARKVVDKAGINHATRVKDLTEEEIGKITEIIDSEYKVEGDLRREVTMNIKRLIEIGSGKLSLEQVRQLLKTGERGKGGATAPPQGLYLLKVFYDTCDLP